MTSAKDDSEKGVKKGFAGLTSLVSDVDETSPDVVNKGANGSEASSETHTEQSTAVNSKQSETSSNSTQPYREPVTPSDGFPIGKWLLSVMAIIGVLWFIGEVRKNSSPSSSVSSSAPTQSSPAQRAASTSTAPKPPSSTGDTQAVKPPVGKDLVFSVPQIRYCLEEDIRLDGARSELNDYSSVDIDKFNAMVSDFNSRCSSFRYRSGALESTRRSVEPHRAKLLAEGASRFARNSVGTTQTEPEKNISTLPPVSQETMVLQVQRRLNELGYNAGPTDGLMGRKTRSAIQQFQRDYGFAATGAVDQLLLQQLQRAKPRETIPNRSSNSTVKLSPEETASLEAACATDKYINGPEAYFACVTRQKSALLGGVRRPSLAKLSFAEQQSIEAACATDKYVNGPSAYNRCLTNQLSLLEASGASRPNLSGLSFSEKQSIEAACSTDKYLNGPAAYNKCLNNQLLELDSQVSRPDLSRLSFADRNAVETNCATDKYLNGPAAYNRCLSRQLAKPRN